MSEERGYGKCCGLGHKVKRNKQGGVETYSPLEECLKPITYNKFYVAWRVAKDKGRI